MIILAGNGRRWCRPSIMRDQDIHSAPSPNQRRLDYDILLSHFMGDVIAESSPSRFEVMSGS